MPTTRQVLLKSRPHGPAGLDNFDMREAELPALADDDVAVRAIYMSLDPYMRGRLDAEKSYAANFEVGAPMIARCVGEVTESLNPKFQAGEVVVGMMDWADHSVVAGGKGIAKVDADLAPLPYFLGLLGMPGLTAWVGMREIGQPKEGETLFVSAASGAVGQLAGQMGKIAGCKVMGCAGTDAKLAYVTEELGFDAVFNHRTDTDYLAAMQRICPDGIDVNFENVGGAMLEAALEHANNYARFIQCGAISQYNLVGDQRYGVKNLEHLHRKRVRMQGFIVTDHWHLMREFQVEVAGWLKAGQIKYKIDITEGLENATQAFLGLLEGENFGKKVIKIGPETVS
ncbi:MAG: NADP-dependent oxidoreductase [Rhodospirillaceae bacterium]|nr:NADP-dependent oxidoreductase [Rhodospirillaceae bacterium]